MCSIFVYFEFLIEIGTCINNHMFGESFVGKTNNILYRVMSGVIFLTHQSMQSLSDLEVLKPAFMLRTCQIGQYICLAYDWMVKDE